MECMDGNEFAEWKEFYRRCPFGPVRGDIQNWQLARIICQANGAKPLPKMQEFLIYFPRQKTKPEPEPEGWGRADDELAQVALQAGIPFTPGPGMTDAAS